MPAVNIAFRQTKPKSAMAKAKKLYPEFSRAITEMTRMRACAIAMPLKMSNRCSAAKTPPQTPDENVIVVLAAKKIKAKRALLCKPGVKLSDETIALDATIPAVNATKPRPVRHQKMEETVALI